IVGGVLLTPARRYLKSPWLWAGAALSVLIFLPNLIWQIRHDFVSLHFLQHIHTRDVGEGRTNHFVRDQFWISASLFAAQLWLAGLYFFFAARDGKRYRLLGWLYIIPFALFLIGKGRGYYLAPVYPMLFAAGGVVLEQWVSSLSGIWRRTVYGVTLGA